MRWRTPAGSARSLHAWSRASIPPACVATAPRPRTYSAQRVASQHRLGCSDEEAFPSVTSPDPRGRYGGDATGCPSRPRGRRQRVGPASARSRRGRTQHASPRLPVWTQVGPLATPKYTKRRSRDHPRRLWSASTPQAAAVAASPSSQSPFPCPRRLCYTLCSEYLFAIAQGEGAASRSGATRHEATRGPTECLRNSSN